MSSWARRRLVDRPGFHGWRVVGWTGFIWGLQSLVWFQGYGNLAVRLREEFGWSKTLFSVGFAATRAESALLGPPQGMALARFGVATMMRIGAVLYLIGFLAMSQVRSQTHFLLALVFIALGTTLAGFLTLTSATVAWFERKRARAVSYSSMGFALGGFLGPLLVVAFNLFGWRATMVGAGIAVFAVCWTLAPVIGVSRDELGQPLDGLSSSQADALPRAEGVQDVHLSAREAIRTRAFWMIALGHGAALLVVSAVMAHLTLYLTEDLNYTAGGAAVVAGLVPVFQLVGTWLGGQLGDRFRKRSIAAVAMVGHGVGLLLLTYATTKLMIGAFVVLHGLAWGTRGPQMSAMRADYFGSTSFGTIMGLSSLVTTMGSVAGPILAGHLADSTGDYQLGFTMLAIGTILGLTFFLLATPPPSSVGAPRTHSGVTR